MNTGSTRQQPIVLAFDSFKGSLDAKAVCRWVREGILSVSPRADVRCCPMADGGEGTARILMDAVGGEWMPAEVCGPLPGRRVDAGWVWNPQDHSAVIEMASASGLPLLDVSERNPLRTTTYGTGELIRRAVKQGAERILLTVGGSATVDGGLGAAAALGWRFLDASGQDVPFTGEGTGRVVRVVPPAEQSLPPMEVLCDVTNPLCGPNGAARVYGPQKGATPAMTDTLEAGLENWAAQLHAKLGVDVRDIPGGGAAGGLAAGAVACFDAKIVRGIDTVMERIGFDEAIQDAGWVLTGEGRLDGQSLQGKVIDGVARRARVAGARVGVIAGAVQLSDAACREAGLDFVAALQAEGVSLEESILRTREGLKETAARFAQSTIAFG